MTMVLENVAELLGVKRARQAPVSSLSMIDMIEEGLPVTALGRISRLIAPQDSAFKYHIVPRATLARRSKQHGRRLSPDESARVTRLAKVWALACDVWGGDNEARAFLFRSNQVLRGRRPIDVALGTEMGAQLVEDILGRLKYGTGL